MSGSSEVVLYRFAFSHFNEKVRWALDLKDVPNQQRCLLPGLHARPIRKLSGGPTSTPLLRDGDQVISGSAAIIAHLEARSPSPALFPEDASLRREARMWVTWLDDEIGPAVRLAFFHELLEDPSLASRLFTLEASRLGGGLYRRLFPRMVPMLRERMQIDEANAEAARKTIDAGLARIAEASGGTGYLVGERFGVVDLTAAALFFPCFFPDELDRVVPGRDSPVISQWLARWQGHSGEPYVRRMWSHHR